MLNTRSTYLPIFLDTACYYYQRYRYQQLYPNLNREVVVVEVEELVVIEVVVVVEVEVVIEVVVVEEVVIEVVVVEEIVIEVLK